VKTGTALGARVFEERSEQRLHDVERLVEIDHDIDDALSLAEYSDMRASRPGFLGHLDHLTK